jgi:hypothetical protein
MKQQLSYQMGDGHNVTGEIPVSYDNFVIEDIEKNIVFEKSNIIHHYDVVMSTSGDSYKGVSKYTYGNILQAIKTIVDYETHNLHTLKKDEATAYLHGEILFSSVTIQKILLLFGIKMSIGKILDDSTRIFESKSSPELLYNICGGLL